MVALIAVAVGLVYRDQIVRYDTHRKGSPRHTVAWAPFAPENPPLLRLALAGDVGDSASRIDATGRAVAGIDAVQRFDGLVVLGDNVYPSGDPAGQDDTVFDPFAEVLDHTSRSVVDRYDIP